MDWEVFTTDGRLRRTHYLAYLFIISIGLYVVQIAFTLILGRTAGIMLSLPFSLVACWPTYCIAVRRAHDMGRGAPFVLGIYGLTVLAVLVTAFAMALAVAKSGAAGPAIGLAGLLMCGAGVMSLMLVFMGPDQKDTWGPDPR